MLQSKLVKPQTYIRTLLNSFSSPSYYLHVLTARFSFSLRFFIISYIILTIISTALFHFHDVPLYRQSLMQSLSQIQANFPEATQITWDKQKLSANTDQPIEIPYPSLFTQTSSSPSTFGLIAPNSSSAAQVVQQNKSSLFVVTSTEFSVALPETGWSSFELKDLLDQAPTFTISSSTLPQYIQAAKSNVNEALSELEYIYPVAFFLFFVITRLSSLAISSIIIFYLLRLAQRPFTFRQVFQVALHIGVVAEVLQLVVGRAFPTLDLSMYTLTFWGYAITIFFVISLQHGMMFTKPRLK